MLMDSCALTVDLASWLTGTFLVQTSQQMVLFYVVPQTIGGAGEMAQWV